MRRREKADGNVGVECRNKRVRASCGLCGTAVACGAAGECHERVIIIDLSICAENGASWCCLCVEAAFDARARCSRPQN